MIHLECFGVGCVSDVLTKLDTFAYVLTEKGGYKPSRDRLQCKEQFQDDSNNGTMPRRLENMVSWSIHLSINNLIPIFCSERRKTRPNCFNRTLATYEHVDLDPWTEYIAVK